MLDRSLDQLVSQFGDLVRHRIRDRALGELRAKVVFVDDRLLTDHIDHPGEELSLPERILDRVGVGTQPVSHHGHDVLEVCADPIHLVDERDPRHRVSVGLPPNRFGLRFDAAHRAEHRDSSVEHPE